MLPVNVTADIMLRIWPFEDGAEQALEVVCAIYPYPCITIERWVQMHIGRGEAVSTKIKGCSIETVFRIAIRPFKHGGRVEDRPKALMWMWERDCYSGMLFALEQVHDGDGKLYGRNRVGLVRLFEVLMARYTPWSKHLINSLVSAYQKERAHNPFSYADVGRLMRPATWFTLGNMQPLQLRLFKRGFLVGVLLPIMRDVMRGPEQPHSGWIINLCKTLSSSEIVPKVMTDTITSDRGVDHNWWWLGLVVGVKLDPDEYARIVRAATYQCCVGHMFRMINGIAGNNIYPHPLSLLLHNMTADSMCLKSRLGGRWAACDMLSWAISYRDCACFATPAIWFVPAVGALFAACDQFDPYYGDDEWRVHAVNRLRMHPHVAVAVLKWAEHYSTRNAFASFIRMQATLDPVCFASKTTRKSRVIQKPCKIVR